MRLAHFLLALNLGWLGQTWTTAATTNAHAHLVGDEDRRMSDSRREPAPDAQRELAFDARRRREPDEASAEARAAAKTDAPKTDAVKTDATKTETVAPFAVPTPLELAWGDTSAPAEPYMDAYRILKASNSCSDFFGGSAQAVEALNDLTASLRPKPFEDSLIAIRMSGRYTRKHNATTGATYRIFDESTVNSRGPFANAVWYPGMKSWSIGRFPAYSRRARVLVLLHELGHLVAGADGRWLLPNDGASHAQSVRNTELVERRCLKQLLEIE